VAALSGRWDFRILESGISQVELRHWFTVHGGDAEREQVIAAVNYNSTRDLAALCRLATLGPFGQRTGFLVLRPGQGGRERRGGLLVRPPLGPVARGATAREPGRAHRAPARRPGHGDGQRHTGWPRSRHAVAAAVLSRRAHRLQAARRATLLLGHCGAWDFAEDNGGGTVVTARHTVAINPAAVTEVLGPGHSLADARRYLREVLVATSRETLEHVGSVSSLPVGAAQGLSSPVG
jgi:aromatase